MRISEGRFEVLSSNYDGYCSACNKVTSKEGAVMAS